MTYHAKKNVSSPSTTWTARPDKLRPDPAGRATRPAKQGRFYGLGKRDRTVPLDVKIRFRGGSEAWYLVEARGRAVAFPGHLCLHDVMREVNRDW